MFRVIRLSKIKREIDRKDNFIKELSCLSFSDLEILRAIYCPIDDMGKKVSWGEYTCDICGGNRKCFTLDNLLMSMPRFHVCDACARVESMYWLAHCSSKSRLFTHLEKLCIETRKVNIEDAKRKTEKIKKLKKGEIEDTKEEIEKLVEEFSKQIEKEEKEKKENGN